MKCSSTMVGLTSSTPRRDTYKTERTGNREFTVNVGVL